MKIAEQKINAPFSFFNHVRSSLRLLLLIATSQARIDLLGKDLFDELKDKLPKILMQEEWDEIHSDNNYETRQWACD